MLLVIEDEHKKHLQFLTTVQLDVLTEFCRISIEFIFRTANPKIYQTAAQKLGVDAEVVRHGVEGLMFLFTESARMMLNDLDFQDSTLAIGFSEELQKELLNYYKDNLTEIRSVLGHLDVDVPHYHGLDWRCDVKLASRSLHYQITPLIIMKLTTENENGKKNVTCFQTDITNLVHMTAVLDQALQEAKSQHSQRVQRHIK